MAPIAVVIGGGNMAEAIIGGAIEARVTRAGDWLVVDPNADRRAVFEAWGVSTGANAADALVSNPDAQLWLAIKPQVFESLGSSFQTPGSRVVVSIMAGVTCDTISRHLGPHVRPIRVMPNTPVRIRMGVSAYAPAAGVSADDAAFARSVFEALGEVVDLPESLLDAFTGLAGSGPAYLFYVAEALVRAGTGVGLSERDASRIVPALLRGSAELLATSGVPPEELRRAVTSPGGTTASGLAALEEGRVAHWIERAVEAARDRGHQLGSG